MYHDYSARTHGMNRHTKKNLIILKKTTIARQFISRLLKLPIGCNGDFYGDRRGTKQRCPSTISHCFDKHMEFDHLSWVWTFCHVTRESCIQSITRHHITWQVSHFAAGKLSRQIVSSSGKQNKRNFVLRFRLKMKLTLKVIAVEVHSLRSLCAESLHWIIPLHAKPDECHYFTNYFVNSKFPLLP